MVVMQINGLNSGYRTNPYMSFGGKREKVNEDKNVSSDLKHSSKSMAKVPVIVLMAMTPGILNSAQTTEKELLANDAPKTVMLAQMPEETLEALQSVETASIAPQATNQEDPLGLRVLRYRKLKKIVPYTDSNGQKKKLVFASDLKDKPESVHFVYIIPENLDDRKLSQAPAVRKLIYHDLGPDKEFCSVRILTAYQVGHGKDDKDSYFKEERIPNEIANEIIDLLTNDTEFRNHTTIKFEETKSAKMEVPHWSR